jgi:predicted nucleic acid-binding protein
VQALKGLREPLLTTWIPITEAMYLLSFSPDAQDALLQMIERGALKVLALGAEDLPPIRALMRKYADQPMDFADASLVRMAERENIRWVFTLDRRDFATYRPARGQGFMIIPDVT